MGQNSRKIRRFCINGYWAFRKLIWFIKPKVKHFVARVFSIKWPIIRFFKKNFSRIKWFFINGIRKEILVLFRIFYAYCKFLVSKKLRRVIKKAIIKDWKKGLIYNFWTLTGVTTKERLEYQWYFLYDLVRSFFVDKKRFRYTRTFCLFLGYSRSGNSLIGSLLDAHPEAIIAHEADSVGLVKLGFSRDRIFSFLTANSKKWAKRKRFVSDYSYLVKESSQGASERILVIGDKESPLTSMRFYFNEGLYEKFKKKISLPIKVIHMTRNPYDTIATMAFRYRQKKLGDKTYENVSDDDLKREADSFFFLVQATSDTAARHGFDMLSIRYEDFLENPKNELSRICDFLGLRADEEYLKKCAQIVFKEPHKSRHEVNWSAESVRFVEEKMSKYTYFKHYQFND